MICITLCDCTIAVLHKQWMCLGMQRNTHITGNNLIPISVPIHFMDVSYMCLQFRSLANCYCWEGRDGYRDQIVTCDVGVSLHSKTHPLLMKYSNGTITQCYAYHYPSLFPVLFLQSLYVPYSKNFSFTCPHSFFYLFETNCMFITPSPPTKNFLTYRGKYNL